MASNLLTTIFGYCGFTTAILFFLAPGTVIYGLNKGSVQINSISGLSIISCYFNCAIWTFSSAILRENDKDALQYLGYCNYSGMLISFIWTVIYLYHFTSKKILKFVVYTFTIVDITIEALIVYFISKANGSETINTIMTYIATVFNILMYLNPGLNILRVMQTGNSRMIYLPSVILGLFNSLFWLLFGCFSEGKVHAIVANAFGLVICLFLAVLYFIFNKKRKESIDPSIIDRGSSIKTKEDENALEKLGLM